MPTEAEVRNLELQEDEREAAKKHMTTQGGPVRNAIEWAMMAGNGGEFGKGPEARLLRGVADAVDIGKPPGKVPFFKLDE